MSLALGGMRALGDPSSLVAGMSFSTDVVGASVLYCLAPAKVGG